MRRHARLITLITCNALQRSVIRYSQDASPLRYPRGHNPRPRNERDKRETAGERNYVFTSRGLALSGDYFWHEWEFAVDGALRKHPAFAENQQNARPTEFSRLARRREESRQGSHADRLCGDERVQVSMVSSTLLLAVLFRSSGMPPLSSRSHAVHFARESRIGSHPTPRIHGERAPRHLGEIENGSILRAREA